MQQIPLADTPRQEMQVTLAGQTTRIRVVWLPLPAQWYISVWLGDQTIALSRQVVTKALLLREHARLSGFVGDLWVSPAEGNHRPPRRAWLQGWHLYYLTEAEADRGDWA